jgi:hypothetical protein
MIQMSLFDFAGSIPATGDLCLGKVITYPIFNEADYLQKGEKILTLLREKRKKEFVPSGLLEAFNLKAYGTKKEYRKLDYLESCATKMLQHKWKIASAKDDFSTLFTQLGLSEVKVTKLDEYDEASKLLKSMLKKKIYEGGVKIQIGGETWYAPIGNVHLTPRQSGRTWHFRGRYAQYQVYDVSLYFAKQYLYHCFRERIHAELDELTVEQVKDNRVADFLHDKISSVFEKHIEENGLIKCRKEVLELPFFKVFVEEQRYSVFETRESAIRISDLLPLWFLSDAPYSRDIIYGQERFIIKLFELIYEVYAGEKQTYEFLKDVETEYAKVYQTKKAIPDKVIAAMTKSGFNDFFGYVEFDEECDLKSLAEIEKEFRALQNRIFHQNERKEEVSLRFRKLGRHRASGLYFPTLKCLCVDVRCPSSMAHEYGHMLDYENGSVSKGVRFSTVRMIYKELLETFISNLSKDDPLRMRLEGYTKYNKAYYLEPTEIFARSLEMYLVRCMKIDNSLVKPEGGFAYPEDEKLLDAISRYYDEFFCVIPAAKVASGY